MSVARGWRRGVFARPTMRRPCLVSTPSTAAAAPAAPLARPLASVTGLPPRTPYLRPVLAGTVTARSSVPVSGSARATGTRRRRARARRLTRRSALAAVVSCPSSSVCAKARRSKVGSVRPASGSAIVGRREGRGQRGLDDRRRVAAQRRRACAVGGEDLEVERVPDVALANEVGGHDRVVVHDDARARPAAAVPAPAHVRVHRRERPVGPEARQRIDGARGDRLAPLDLRRDDLAGVDGEVLPVPVGVVFARPALDDRVVDAVVGVEAVVAALAVHPVAIGTAHEEIPGVAAGQVVLAGLTVKSRRTPPVEVSWSSPGPPRTRTRVTPAAGHDTLVPGSV